MTCRWYHEQAGQRASESPAPGISIVIQRRTRLRGSARRSPASLRSVRRCWPAALLAGGIVVTLTAHLLSARA
ncbi:MAG TPA: hypothetical protein VF940_12385 [Streptosporangiaceae bacterium]